MANERWQHAPVFSPHKIEECTRECKRINFMAEANIHTMIASCLSSMNNTKELTV